ncbi:alginate export family protein, partial [Acinetobacter baumannii]
DTPTHPTRDRHLTSITLRWLAPTRPGKFDFEVEGLRQTGSISASLAASAARLPVEAWFGHAELGYQWRGGWQPHLVMEGDYASGDHRH